MRPPICDKTAPPHLENPGSATAKFYYVDLPLDCLYSVVEQEDRSKGPYPLWPPWTVADPGGAEGAMPPPRALQKSHEKDSRIDFMFLAPTRPLDPLLMKYVFKTCPLKVALDILCFLVSLTQQLDPPLLIQSFTKQRVREILWNILWSIWDSHLSHEGVPHYLGTLQMQYCLLIVIWF